MDDESVDDATIDVATSDRPGDVLKRAREAQSLSLGDVAEKTRVPIRQLEAVERNDFSALPGTPYAVGFARAYARAVGVDEVALAHAVRVELGTVEQSDRYEMFEPVDPARVPPRWLAWAAAVIAVLLAVGYGVWRTHVQVAPTEAELATPASTSERSTPIAGPAPAPVAGPVVLTAADAVWVRIYDQNGVRILEKEMAKGESFTVPATAPNPMILTGRPDALAVTVGGKPVAPLGPPNKTVVDLPISATALLSRPAASSAVVPTPAPPASPPAPPVAVNTGSTAPAPATNAAAAAD